MCKHQVSHPVAAVTVDALHSALTDPEQCKHLLLHTHTVMGEGLQSDTEEGFGGALRGLRGELTSQLTLGACMFRLCAQVSLHPCCATLSMNGQAQNNWLQALQAQVMSCSCWSAFAHDISPMDGSWLHCNIDACTSYGNE